MDRQLKIGDHVTFLDADRTAREALVTTIWSGAPPGCNLVVVSGDEGKTDNYGRQIERFTSVVHLSQQPAGGWCWCWPDEVPGR